MKNLLLMAVAASGLLVANASDANAQSWGGGRNSGFGISLNFGSQQGRVNQHSQNYSQNGFGYNVGRQHTSPFSYHSDFNNRRGHSNLYSGPAYGYQQNFSRGISGYSNRYTPVRQYGSQRGYGYGGCGF